MALADGGTPDARKGGFGGCSEGDTSYTTGSLHDVRSFSDAVAIVRGVRESLPPTPEGPEGWAGYIGRRVDVRVERILWRRPNAPEPPRSFTYNDLGWSGTLKHRTPLLGCRQARLKLGRRYLAPIVRDHGTWYPFFTTRLRLRGDLVVGGVDQGEPEDSHAALQGRRVGGAVRLIAEALPYRSVVLHPAGSPGRRWQRAYRDQFWLWGGKRGLPIIARSGVTARSRWQLYVRLPASGGMCVGMSVRALWHPVPAPSGEGCGPRRVADRALRPGLFFARHRGLFAYGRAGAEIVQVRVRFGGEDWQEVDTYPTPHPLRDADRFWVVPARGSCAALTAHGIDRRGKVVAAARLQAACRAG
jgi:hypothetical protein